MPQLSAFDDLMNGLLEKWQIPGAAIGVSHNGRLMLARGYGLAERADQKTGELVQPDSLFRVARISRTITAAAILRLVEDGKLSLDQRVFSILTEGSEPADPSVSDVTVRDLLAVKTPVVCRDDSWEASNCEYHILGAIIEKTSGLPYETYVKSHLLMPLGIARMELGRTTLTGRKAGEVHYYDYLDAPVMQSVISKDGEVPRPYGAQSIEAMKADAGWIASVSDLLRLVNALDGRRPPSLLRETTLPAMIAPPWGGDSEWWSYGAFAGVSAFVFREAATGVDAVLLFNSRPRDGGLFDADVTAGILRTVKSTVNWPAFDRFTTGPELFARDIVNAADRRGGGVAPGEIVVAFPSNAGPAEIAEWPTGSTAATRVFFDNIAAPIVYAVAGQVSAIVPHEVSNKKTTEVVIEYQGVRSQPVRLPVVDSAPAFFTRDASGKGQAAMLNVTGCCNSARNPAMPGALAYLFATGEGLALTREDKKFIEEKPSPVPVPVPDNLKVTVGGVPAEIVYAGDAGVLQINIRIPEKAPIGPAVPLVLTVGNSHSSDEVTIAVRSSVVRVLVFEHTIAVRNRLIKILQGAGFEVVTALDELEVKRRITEGPVDLVVTDLAMPQQAGLQMIRTIQNENPELKIMVMSGESGGKALRAADMLGAQAVLSNTATSQVLLRRVHEILRAHIVAF